MPIDPDSHRLYYDYVFIGTYLDIPLSTEAIQVRADGYQQVISIGAFVHGLRTKGKPGDIKTHRTYDKYKNLFWRGRVIDDYLLEQKQDRRAAVKFQNDSFLTLHPDPIRFFDTVYEFYEAINYDYKKKRFMPAT